MAAARYADGRSQPVAGPNARYVSNRIFNDTNQNVFSERSVTQWGFVVGPVPRPHLRSALAAHGDPNGGTANIPFNAADPLETSPTRSASSRSAAPHRLPGTGVTNARQQVNTVSSYIDALAVYGGTTRRLDWLREGSVDGNPANNSARCCCPTDYLPRRDARGNAATAPTMDDRRPAARQARTGPWSPATCGPTRTSR